MSELSDITEKLRAFARERDWDQFHAPKNLAMAIGAETGELLEIFQWLSSDQSAAIMRDQRIATAVQHEVADIFIYLLRLADVLGIDIAKAVDTKLSVNAQKYPAEKARGSAKKYTELGE